MRDEIEREHERIISDLTREHQRVVASLKLERGKLRVDLKQSQNLLSEAKTELWDLKLELEDDHSQITQLKAQKTELEARVEVAEAQSQAMACQPCDSEVEAWRQGLTKPTDYPQPHLVESSTRALIELVPRGHVNECAWMRRSQVACVRRVANTQLWKRYLDERKQIAERIRNHSECPWATEVASGCKELRRHFPHVQLDEYANEVLLLHGCQQGSVPHIVENGFDERFSKRGLYGNGVYFTFESCKAAQYTGQGTHGTIILARVILGHPFLAEGPLSCVPMLEKYSVPYDSTIVRPGISKGKGKGGKRQTHWEFVVQRGSLQAYPELLIDFTFES